MDKPLRILLIEDSPDDALLVERELRRGGFVPQVRRVETELAFRAALEGEDWDLILSDFSMPLFDGISAHRIAQEAKPDVPFIFVSGRIGEERAADAMRRGARDYILKDNLVRLVPAVLRELEQSKAYRERRAADRALKESEQKYRTLVEGSLQGIMIVQRGRVAFCNGATARLFGFRDPAELIGTVALERVHPEDRHASLLPGAPDMVAGQPKVLPYYRGVRKDGTVIWYEARPEMITWQGARAVQWSLVDISERRIAEEELALKERLLSGMLETIPHPVFIKDVDGRYVVVNRAWCQRYNCKPWEALGKLTHEVPGRPTADKDRAAAEDRRVMVEERRPIQFHGTDTTSDGRVLHFQSFKAPLLDAQGLVTGLVGVVVDTTEIKHAEEELRASQNLLQTVFDTIPHSLIVKDRESRYLMVNKAWSAYFGPDAAAVRNLLPTDLHHRPADENERYLSEDRQVLAQGATMSFDGNYTDRHGQQRQYHSIKAPLRDPEGQVMGLLALLVDVTAERVAQHKADLAHARLLDAIESLPAAFFLYDAQERLVLWNSQVNEFFPDVYPHLAAGMRFEDILRFGAKTVVEAANREDQYVEERLRQFREIPGLFEQRTRQGRWLQGIDRRTADGGTVALRFDVSDLKNREAELRQAQKMEAVGQLTGGVAHDFNNILTVILASVEFLLRGMRPDDPLRRDAVVIQDAGRRAAGLTRQLLAFSRRQMLNPKTVDLNALVSDMSGMLRRLISENIQIDTRLHPDLPTLRADPGQIEQILMNLAVNARDAMPSGGTLTIETGRMVLDKGYAATHFEAKPGPHIMLAVTDTGIGMTEEVRSRIFDPFFTTKPVGKGTGLGLSTVYGIVKQMNGSIYVYSEVNRGTAFKIFLPLPEDASGAAETVAAPQSLAKPSETILLVEDDDLVRQSVARILEQAGYRVLGAPGGPQALELVHAHGAAIHMLLSDVVLQNGTGVELWEEIKGIRPLPVLFMSGYTSDAVTRQGILEGELPYLPKPFSSDALLEKVRHVLDRRA